MFNISSEQITPTLNLIIDQIQGLTKKKLIPNSIEVGVEYKQKLDSGDWAEIYFESGSDNSIKIKETVGQNFNEVMVSVRTPKDGEQYLFDDLFWKTAPTEYIFSVPNSIKFLSQSPQLVELIKDIGKLYHVH